MLREGAVVSLTPKAFDTLVALIERRERVVGKEELLHQLWPDVAVEEASLTQQIFLLRKALDDTPEGQQYIATVPRRGYRFVADVTESTTDGPLTPGIATARRWPPLLIAGIVGVALVAGVATRLGTHPRGVAEMPKVDALAVLPLVNLIGDREQEYLVAGMHEALITELGQIRALSVISRTSVTRYQNTQKTLPEIARELDVDALVEGSMSRTGDSVRVQVRVILAAPTERQLWSGAFDGELRDIVKLQKRIASEVSEQIRINLTPQEAARLATNRPVEPAAYDAWARGRFQLSLQTKDSLNRCLEHAAAALAIDSSYAAAHALTAMCHDLLPAIGSVAPRAAFEKAEAAARRALELDEGLADAHIALAWNRAVYRWDWEAAERGFRRGLELNPGSADGHRRLGWFLSWLGRHDEAVSEVRRALQLNPIGHNELGALAVVNYVARRPDDALAAARRAIEVKPDFVFAHARLGLAYSEKGMYEDAIAAFETAVKLSGGGLNQKASLARMYALAGRRSEARRILGDLMDHHRKGRVAPVAIAVVHAALGERDQALRWLEEGYRLHDGDMILLKVWPAWEPLRAEDRYKELVRRMGFP